MVTAINVRGKKEEKKKRENGDKMFNFDLVGLGVFM